MSNGLSKAGTAQQEYLEQTGRCPLCHVPMDDHPQCGACTALCGPGHENDLLNFRDQSLCASCIRNWKNLDRIASRETTWQEFVKPSLSLVELAGVA